MQSVGGVMRRAKDKDYGYIILPVGIPRVAPRPRLKDSKEISHLVRAQRVRLIADDRFEAMVNHIDLNPGQDDHAWTDPR